MDVRNGLIQTEDSKVLRAKELPSLEREYRDLITSLRALCVVMREPPGDPVLARILDAEIHQLDVLGGELLAAVRLDTSRPGEVDVVDLSKELSHAIKRSGRHTDHEIRGRVMVEGHAPLIRQSIASVLALAHRIADGRVRATAYQQGHQGVVLVTTKVDDPALARQNGRLGILHRLARADGGRLLVQRKDGEVHLRLAFWTP